MSGTVMIHLDDREVAQLAIDLEEAPKRIQFASKSAMRKSADLVKFRMKADARGHRYLPRFPHAVTSTVYDAYNAEIGFETTPGTQGRLAHIILYGSVNNLPVYDYTWALRRSERDIEEFFGIEAEGAVLGNRDA